MNTITIRPASVPEDIPVIVSLAEQTWAPTYQHILSREQLQYMFAEIYHPDSLNREIKNGQTYLLLYHHQIPVAFASYSPLRAALYKLNKLYVVPAYHGLGYGKLLIEAVQEIVRAAGGHILELNVNRNNPAKAFYEKCGFSVIRAEDIPIGPYWMNDYSMQKNL